MCKRFQLVVVLRHATNTPSETLSKFRPAQDNFRQMQTEKTFWSTQVSLAQSHEEMVQDHVSKDPYIWEITRRINGCIEVGPKRARYTIQLEVQVQIDAGYGKPKEKSKLLKRNLRMTSACEGRGSGWHRPVLLLPIWSGPGRNGRLDRCESGVDCNTCLRELFVDSGLAVAEACTKVDPVNWTAPSPFGGMHAASGLLKAVLRKLRKKYEDPEASTWSVLRSFTEVDIEAPRSYWRFSPPGGALFGLGTSFSAPISPRTE